MLKATSQLKKQQFKKLQQLWYEKAAKSGFEDIEKDEWTLKRPFKSTMLKTKHGLIRSGRWEQTLEYYLQVEHFLNAHEFASERERIIWEYHSQGLGVRAIAKVLSAVKIKTNPQSVWLVVKHLSALMKERLKNESYDE